MEDKQKKKQHLIKIEKDEKANVWGKNLADEMKEVWKMKKRRRQRVVPQINSEVNQFQWLLPEK